MEASNVGSGRNSTARTPSKLTMKSVEQAMCSHFTDQEVEAEAQSYRIEAKIQMS